MTTLTDLARGVGVPEYRLKRQLEGAAIRRKSHFWSRKGWSYDKGKTMMAEAVIPLWLWLHPKFKDTFFSNDADKHEREKNMRKLLNMYPELKAR